MPEKNGPIWAMTNRVPRQYPWLDDDEQCGVCVIGGGFAGALCALKLAERGEDVVLITAAQIGFGATANAMPCAEYDSGTTLMAMTKTLGRQNAAAVMELGVQAIGALEDIAFGLGERCSFTRRDCLLFADSQNEAEMLSREFTERRSAGFDCSYVSRSAAGDVFGFEMLGGIISKGMAAQFDPFVFTHLCIEKAAEHGARVYENTKAERMETDGDKILLTTSTHRTVSAGQVIIASGSASSDIIEGIVYPRTYFMAASKPVRQFSGWPGRCVIRSWEQPRLTMAVSPDERICVCGLDTAVVDEQSRLGGVVRIPSLHEKRFAQLQEHVRYVFPQMYVPEFEAVSAFRGCRSADGLPIIGRFDGMPRCIFAACFGAGGMLMSVIAAELAACLCAGEEPEMPELFSPERKALRR